MKKVLAALLLLSLLSIAPAHAQRKKATLLVLIDLSSSMDKHRKKLKLLAPLVEEAMKKSRCDYQVAVGGILYKDNADVDLTPWGQPSFVTSKTPDGFNKITTRIADPEMAIFDRELSEQDEADYPNGSSEITYSSIVDSIKHNFANIKNSDVLGTLLVTDAAPGFETRSPEQAINEIRSLLGQIPYVPGIIAAPFKNGETTIQAQTCKPDFNGTLYRNPADPKWLSQDLEALKRFSQLGHGYQWDICQPDYENTLREFLQLIMDAAGCQLIV